jgi:hypothetical protein
VTSGTGTVSASGLFTAPNRQESDTVQAQSPANQFVTAIASITLPAVGIQIQPGTADVVPGGTQQFTATVSGTVTTGVQWSETGNGTVNQSGVYTAPSTIESTQLRQQPLLHHLRRQTPPYRSRLCRALRAAIR